jgi:hypothetical protein
MQGRVSESALKKLNISAVFVCCKLKLHIEILYEHINHLLSDKN